MDDLRELNERAMELLGWTKEMTADDGRIIWKRGSRYHKGHLNFTDDPVACAELDGEMQKRGYYLGLHHYRDGWYAEYFIQVGPYATECEARTRAAVRALSGEGEK